MRKRGAAGRAGSPCPTNDGGAAGRLAAVSQGAELSYEKNGQIENSSLLKARCAKDIMARLFFVGIFITENLLHATYFEHEINTMVAPALDPLPREAAVCLHLVHIIFGMFGAIFVLVSGFDTAGRTALTKGTSMMLVFMSTITWTWWINRQGKPYWELDEFYFWEINASAEKRNRTVHILKNVSIVGALTMMQQLAKYETIARPGHPSFLEGLVTALRPWSFTATLAPQFVSLAVLRCRLGFYLPGYIATFMLLLSIMAIQATANLVNSYRDFKRGIDTAETAGDRTLVDGLVSETTLGALAGFSLIWWCVFFVWSLIATGFDLVVLGMAALGTCLAIGYTAGPAPLKYLGLGDLAVFLCFGPAVIAYSSAVLVGSVPWEAIAFSTPVTLYVVATLHANNYRDIEADSRAGARTVAIMLGHRASRYYYDFLLAGAHIGALLAGYCCGCVGVVGSLWVVPQSLWLCHRLRNPKLLRDQDEETAKTTMMFGVSLALGILTMPQGDLSPHGVAVAGLTAGVLKVFAD